MLVVRFVREKEGEAEITKGNVPVKTEHREKQREVLYLITSILDAEGKGGFIGGDIIHRQNRKLVLTDKADNAIEQVTASKENNRPQDTGPVIDNLVWNERELRSKVSPNSKTFSKPIANLWQVIATGKPAIISFKSEEGANLAYDTLITAGFTPDMVKKTRSEHSIKITGVPAEFKIDALRERLIGNLTRKKAEATGEEQLAKKEKQEQKNKAVEESFNREFSQDELRAFNPKKAAEFVRGVIDSPYVSEVVLDEVRFILTQRKDSAKVMELLRAIEPSDPVTFRPFSVLSDKEYIELIESYTKGKPIPVSTKITGNELADLREEERKRRGGPSAIEKAAAMPWKIEPALYRRLEKGDEVLFYTFTSAQRYAEARASVEALFPGRAIALEHTPEIEGGRDVGEWVMTVKPKGAKVDEGALIAGRVGWKGVPADPSEKPSLQTNPFKQTVGGQTRYISAADAIKDAVNNYNAYSTKFSVSTSDISTRPDWFMSLVMGRNIGDLRIKDPLRQALLAKGVNINVEIAGTSYRMEGGREVVSGYTYVVTISGENVRKPLEVARNEACSKPAGLPEPQLKRIAAFEGQEPKKEPTYAERMAALKKKVPPGS